MEFYILDEFSLTYTMKGYIVLRQKRLTYGLVIFLNVPKDKDKERYKNMDVILEQFIPSDRPKRVSKMLKNISIIFFVVALMIVFGSLIIGITLGIVGFIFFLGSYLAYIDYEYELYSGDITITRVYNASRRKIAQKINRDAVRRVYLTAREDALKKGVTAYYNTNLEGLNIYTFELNNNKVVQLALNEELEKIVRIIYAQSMTH